MTDPYDDTEPIYEEDLRGAAHAPDSWWLGQSEPRAEGGTVEPGGPSQPPPPPPPSGSAPEGGPSRARTFALLLVAVLAAGGLGAGLGATFASSSPNATSEGGNPLAGATTIPPPTTGSKPPALDTNRISALVDPAVVDVISTIAATSGGGQAEGTGMIVTPGGEILTNNHVVEGATTVEVQIPGHGRQSARVVGTNSNADVAVLQVSGLDRLPTVHLGDSATVATGDRVVAIGNALGLGGTPTVTTGIVSALNRSITATGEGGSNPEQLTGLLQTDAPIEPGDSGGPLVDDNGAVIGMDTAAETGGASVGFAIPINTAHGVANAILTGARGPGIVLGRPGILGIEVGASSSGNIGPFGNFGTSGPSGPSGTSGGGVLVDGVATDTPAQAAGIVAGDVILDIDGNPTKTVTDLTNLIHEHPPGSEISVTFSGGGSTKTLHITLAEGPVA